MKFIITLLLICVCYLFYSRVKLTKELKEVNHKIAVLDSIFILRQKEYDSIALVRKEQIISLKQ